MIVRRIYDYNDKSWKVKGAFWLDSDIILDMECEDYTITSVVDQVDLTHEEWIDDRGECWLPKDGTKLYALEVEDA